MLVGLLYNQLGLQNFIFCILFICFYVFFSFVSLCDLIPAAAAVYELRCEVRLVK